MTQFQADSSTPFEYKIIRSCGQFKKPAKFKAILEKEAAAGWELLEKFDDSRARLKRPITCRQKDPELGDDPYRTNVGVGQGTIVLWAVLGTLVGIGALIGIIALILK